MKLFLKILFFSVMLSTCKAQSQNPDEPLYYDGKYFKKASDFYDKEYKRTKEAVDAFLKKKFYFVADELGEENAKVYSDAVTKFWTITPITKVSQAEANKLVSSANNVFLSVMILKGPRLTPLHKSNGKSKLVDVSSVILTFFPGDKRHSTYENVFLLATAYEMKYDVPSFDFPIVQDGGWASLKPFTHLLPLAVKALNQDFEFVKTHDKLNYNEAPTNLNFSSIIKPRAKGISFSFSGGCTKGCETKDFANMPIWVQKGAFVSEEEKALWKGNKTNEILEVSAEEIYKEAMNPTKSILISLLPPVDKPSKNRFESKSEADKRSSKYMHSFFNLKDGITYNEVFDAATQEEMKKETVKLKQVSFCSSFKFCF